MHLRGSTGGIPEDKDALAEPVGLKNSKKSEKTTKLQRWTH
jgi:hypothetical protein